MHGEKSVSECFRPLFAEKEEQIMEVEEHLFVGAAAIFCFHEYFRECKSISMKVDCSLRPESQKAD